MPQEVWPSKGRVADTATQETTTLFRYVHLKGYTQLAEANLNYPYDEHDTISDTTMIIISSQHVVTVAGVT